MKRERRGVGGGGLRVTICKCRCALCASFYDMSLQRRSPTVCKNVL